MTKPPAIGEEDGEEFNDRGISRGTCPDHPGPISPGRLGLVEAAELKLAAIDVADGFVEGGFRREVRSGSIAILAMPSPGWLGFGARPFRWSSSISSWVKE